MSLLRPHLRATTDTPAPVFREDNMAIRSRRLRDQYEQLLRPKRYGEKIKLRYEKLRRLVVLKGIPSESVNESTTHQTHCSLRGRVWKMLLGVQSVDAQEYVYQVQRTTSVEMSEKIEKDIERTFKNNVTFHNRVTDDQLRRVLNAYVNSMDVGEEDGEDGEEDGEERRGTGHATERKEQSGKRRQRRNSKKESSGGLYVQGMNVLAAPFLYVMNELDAYSCLRRLLNHHCPQYITKDLHGAQHAAQLLQEILKHIDPILENHIHTMYNGDWGSVTSLPTLLSMSADKPCETMDELLKLWDVLFALGVHMNVIFVVAHMILMRNVLLKGNHQLLQSTLCVHKNVLPMKANLIISLSLHIVQKLPNDVYDRLECHPYNK